MNILIKFKDFELLSELISRNGVDVAPSKTERYCKWWEVGVPIGSDHMAIIYLTDDALKRLADKESMEDQVTKFLEDFMNPSEVDEDEVEVEGHFVQDPYRLRITTDKIPHGCRECPVRTHGTCRFLEKMIPYQYFFNGNRLPGCPMIVRSKNDDN